MPHPVLFSELCQKKLIMISGKGGVGKSTISAALALRLGQEGKKVALAEIDSQGQLASLFGHPPFGYKETSLGHNVYGLNVTSEKALEEYVVRQLKFHTLYKAVFDNKYVRAFMEGTPGLAELMCIGKVVSLVDDYDIVVLDAPATGHGMSLLQVPTVATNAIRVGPLKARSEEIEKILRDPSQTCLAVVSLAEEMPVTETLELQAWTQKNLGISLGIAFINGIYPPLFENESDFQLCDRFFKDNAGNSNIEGLFKSYQMRRSRSDLHSHYAEILKRELKGIGTIEIPYYFTESLNGKELRKIGEIISLS